VRPRTAAKREGSAPRTTPYRDADEALREIERGWRSRASRHWPDLLLGAGLLILIARFAFVAVDARQRKPEPEVRARFDLPAFTVLRAGHLARDSGARPLEGRYLLRPVQAKSPVRSADLGPAYLGSAQLANRYALPVQLTAGASPDSLRPGTIATLLLSPAAAGATAPALIIHDVPVLASTSGTQAVVAVTRAQLDSVAPRLGTSRVFILTTVNR
jgi:hypothetical protein